MLQPFFFTHLPLLNSESHLSLVLPVLVLGDDPDLAGHVLAHVADVHAVAELLAAQLELAAVGDFLAVQVPGIRIW